MNVTVCPVAELEREALATMDVLDAAEREGRRRKAGKARSRVLALRLAQTYAVAASERGFALQLIERDIARDEGDFGNADRIDAVICEGIKRLP